MKYIKDGGIESQRGNRKTRWRNVSMWMRALEKVQIYEMHIKFSTLSYTQNFYQKMVESEKFLKILCFRCNHGIMV